MTVVQIREQITGGIKLVAVDGVTVKRRSEYYPRVLGQQVGKLKAAKFRHLYVEKQQVHGVATKLFHGLHSTIVHANEFEFGCLLRIRGKQLGRQRLVIYYRASQYHKL